MTNKEEFCQILRTACKDRFDVEKIINLLETKTDFFVAPASTKYHLAVEGGLCKHSLDVYHTLDNLCELYDSSIPKSSIAICGLFHDLCKANFYKKDYRNVKINNAWTTQSCYTIDDKIPLGHGEKSVILLLQMHIDLTLPEVLAIRWHMGGFDNATKGGDYAQNSALNMTSLVGLLQAADIISASVIERKI